MLQNEKARKAQGEKGKTAEDDVKKYLNALNSRVAEFEFERIYDARSAGGKFPSRPGDFEFFRLHRGAIFAEPAQTWHGLIEVKELEHDYRLPAARLNTLPKLVKRAMCGGIIVVLIKNPLTGKWRNPPFEFFRANQGVKSWDLRPFKEWDRLDDLMFEIRALR